MTFSAFALDFWTLESLETFWSLNGWTEMSQCRDHLLPRARVAATVFGLCGAAGEPRCHCPGPRTGNKVWRKTRDRVLGGLVPCAKPDPPPTSTTSTLHASDVLQLQLLNRSQRQESKIYRVIGKCDHFPGQRCNFHMHGDTFGWTQGCVDKVRLEGHSGHP